MIQQNIWDFWAKNYEKLWVQKFSLKPTREMILSELEKIIGSKQGINLLDVGCGTGQLLTDIQKRFYNWNGLLTGLDSSAEMIHRARAKKLPNTQLVRGDALDLPFPNNEFDVITCCHSFPYYEDKIRALKEFKRVLKPGGYILLIQASESNVYDWLVMKFVKLTTGKASYPSASAIKEMVNTINGQMIEQKRLRTEFYMPSIILSIIQNGDKI